ncbi:BTAD domain-containing putative transcriptional regulator [Nocardia sp. NPDC058666]
MPSGHGISWTSTQSASLLALLLTNEGKHISKTQLEEMLWLSVGKSVGPSSVKVAVHTLRKYLTRDFGANRTVFLIEGGARGYVLRNDGDVRVDSSEFERTWRKGSDAAWRGSRDDALAMFRHAMSTYQGDFIPGRSEAWAEEHREWLRSKAMHALEVLLGDACRLHDAADVMYYGRRMLELDPTDERAFVAMMVTHARRRELDQVKYWYELCRSRLWEKFEVPPSATTTEVFMDAVAGSQVEFESVLPM